MASMAIVREIGVMTGIVICAVEQPAGAKSLVRLAASLSHRLEHKLMLVSLIAPGPGVPHGLGAEGSALQRSLIGQRWQQLKTLAHDAGCNGAECLVDIASPGRGLRVLAEHFDAAMMVLGSSGLGPLRSALSGGSVTRRLAMESSRVLVVLPAADNTADLVDAFANQPPRMICGYDGSEESIGAVDAAASFASRFETELVLVSVVKPSGRATVRGVPRTPGPSELQRERDARLDLLHEALRHVDSEIRTRIETATGDPAEVLDRQARDHIPSMIAVGSRGRGAIAETLMGSVSATLVRSASAPVLISPMRRVPELQSHPGELGRNSRAA
jgi:nucleotide-binding universal stress UspA family protein